MQGAGQLQLDAFARRVNALRIDHVELLGHIGFARQGQHQLLESRIQLGVTQHAAHRVDEARVQLDVTIAVHRAQDAAQRQLLAGFPTVERIVVVAEQGKQSVIAQLGFQHHRC